MKCIRKPCHLGLQLYGHQLDMYFLHCMNRSELMCKLAREMKWECRIPRARAPLMDEKGDENGGFERKTAEFGRKTALGD